MQTTMLKTIAALTMGLGMAACAEATSRCGAGEGVNVNGSTYCVYKESIVIVGGFDCPASMPFRRDFENATVCGNHGFDNLDVPEDICARAFVPCTEPEQQSDAGSAVCETGFDDCDGNAINGCESALNTAANCGACGHACGTPWCQAGRCLPWPPIFDAGPGAYDDPRCPEVNDEVCDGLDNDCNGAVDDNARVSDSCKANNSEAWCASGSCRVGTCNEGFGDCDADGANGCETALNTLDNCGACGVDCAGALGACSTGQCRVDTLP